MKPDTKHRFRLISTAAMAPFRVSVDDHLLTLIAVDGLDIEPVTMDGFIVYSAERFDFVLETDQSDVGTDFWVRAEVCTQYAASVALSRVSLLPAIGDLCCV